MAGFEPDRILEVLERYGVEYVLIGGLAAAMHGAPIATTDVDITPRADDENLDRLSDALRELKARIRTKDVPGGLPFDHSGTSFGDVSIWNLVTEFGDLDISLSPAGTDGYGDLSRHAFKLNIGGVEVPVASLPDVIRSKEAADREKDHLTLPVLRRTLEEIRRRENL